MNFQFYVTGLPGTPDENFEAINNFLSTESGLFNTVARVVGKKPSDFDFVFGLSATKDVLRISVKSK